MSAARAASLGWLKFPEREAAPAPRVRTACMRCGGTGWRPVLAKGDRAVTRCECVLDRMREARELRVAAVKQMPRPDYKAAAAGER